MISAPKKSDVQMALEEVTADIVSCVGDLQKSYVDDLKRLLSTLPLAQLNFNALVKTHNQNIPIFYLLMEAAEGCEALKGVLAEFFMRLPLCKLNWNFEVRHGNAVSTSLLVLMRSAANGQEWAQKAVVEVFSRFSIVELGLNVVQQEGTYQDQTILAILLYCAYDNKLWACSALKIIVKKLKIETELTTAEMAALGLIMCFMFSDAAWAIDGLKIVSQSPLCRYYGWAGLVANHHMIMPSAIHLTAKLAVIGHPRFLQNLLRLDVNAELDFNLNMDEESIIDILASTSKTRGLACQVMLTILSRDQRLIAINEGLVKDLSRIIARTVVMHCKMYSIHYDELQIFFLAKALGEALAPYLADMLEKDRCRLLADYAKLTLKKREKLKKPAATPAPVNYDEIAVSFGYHLNVAEQPQPQLLISFESFNATQNERQPVPALLPPPSLLPSSKP